MAMLPSFIHYSYGVYSHPLCGPLLDHAMTAVGYGYDSETGLDYILVKNSFGESWGEAGYIRFADVPGIGMCGLNLDASYPIV